MISGFKKFTDCIWFITIKQQELCVIRAQKDQMKPWRMLSIKCLKD